MRAYNETGQIWELHPSIKSYHCLDGTVKPVLNLMGPCEYFMSTIIELLEKEVEGDTLCIDAGGRNFESSSPVRVAVRDLRQFLITAREPRPIPLHDIKH